VKVYEQMAGVRWAPIVGQRQTEMMIKGVCTPPKGKAMAKKRMVLEIGMGTDIRGTDPTKAACRALRDALGHNSLSIASALGQPPDAMIVDVHIGVPWPEMVDKEQVLAVLPYGKGTVTLVEGGLEIRNDAAPTARSSPTPAPSSASTSPE
jgi:uncharacterized protein (TIGR02058 family)